MLRTIGGTILGLLVAVVSIMAIEWVGHQLFPPPPGVDINDPESLRGMLESATIGAKLVVLVAWFAGTLIGAWVADFIARAEWPRWVVAGFVLLGVLLNVFTINHPGWMIALGIAAPLVAAWIAGRLPRPQLSSDVADES